MKNQHIEKIMKRTIVVGLVCQCPISGNSHFYGEMVLGTSDAECVNALYRAIPISTTQQYATATLRKVVSMPYIGQFPFLQLNRM